MKEYKERVLNELQRLAYSHREIQLKSAAEKAGVKRLTHQEALEILNIFILLNPQYKIYRLIDSKEKDFFSTAIVSELEYD